MFEIELTNADREFARTIYTKFSTVAGNEHIASGTALEFLSASLRIFKPRTVLELGAGIGTITEALLTHSSRIELLVAAEQNEFCLRALRQNLTNSNDTRLTIVSTPYELSRLNLTADLIVGDGGFYSREEAKCAAYNSIIFAEGDRKRLRRLFAQVLEERGQTLQFRQFGARRQYIVEIRKWFRFSIHRIPSKGCWIGQVS